MIQSYIILTQTYLNKLLLSKFIATAFFDTGRIDKFWERSGDDKVWDKMFNSGRIQVINLAKKDDFKSNVTSFYQKYEVPHLLFLGDLNEYSPELQEGMLKFLEEPPTNLTIILFAQNSNQIIPTITSRCIRINLPKSVVFENLDTTSLESIKKDLPSVSDTIKQLTKDASSWTVPELKDVERDQLDFWLWQLLSYLQEYYKQNPNLSLASLITKVTEARNYNSANLQKKLSLGWIKT